MAKISGLILQPKKCVIIPLVPGDSKLYPCYSVLIQKHFPAWASFKICSHAEYLGFEIGPTAGSAQFSKVISSFNLHLSTILATGAPPSVSVFTFNVKMITNFSYKSQLVPLPLSIFEEVVKWHCNILKAPFNSFPLSLLF